MSAAPAAVGSGPITLSGGDLSATAPATYPNAVNVPASSLLASTGSVNFGGGLSLSNTLSVTGGGVLNFTGSTILSGAPTFSVPAGTLLTLSGPVRNSGSAS